MISPTLNYVETLLHNIKACQEARLNAEGVESRELTASVQMKVHFHVNVHSDGSAVLFAGLNVQALTASSPFRLGRGPRERAYVDIVRAAIRAEQSTPVRLRLDTSPCELPRNTPDRRAK